jgi:hypothetical protein
MAHKEIENAGSTRLTCDLILTTLQEHADEIKQKFHVRQLGLFGSHVRDAMHTDSDVDILVELERPTFDNYMDLKFYLEDLFQRKVDLVMADSIKPRLRPYIMDEVQYAQGLQALS